MQTPFHIVALGASAGGLEPIENILRALPVDTGFAFVVIQHVGPDSLLAEVLARFTEMPVHLIEDGMRLQPNHLRSRPFLRHCCQRYLSNRNRCRATALP